MALFCHGGHLHHASMMYIISLYFFKLCGRQTQFRFRTLLKCITAVIVWDANLLYKQNSSTSSGPEPLSHAAVSRLRVQTKVIGAMSNQITV